MLGTIIGTNDNEVLIKLNINLYEFGSLINYYVIMEHEDRKIVGEIVDKLIKELKHTTCV